MEIGDALLIDLAPDQSHRTLSEITTIVVHFRIHLSEREDGIAYPAAQFDKHASLFVDLQLRQFAVEVGPIFEE